MPASTTRTEGRSRRLAHRKRASKRGDAGRACAGMPDARAAGPLRQNRRSARPYSLAFECSDAVAAASYIDFAVIERLARLVLDLLGPGLADLVGDLVRQRHVVEVGRQLVARSCKPSRRTSATSATCSGFSGVLWTRMKVAPVIGQDLRARPGWSARCRSPAPRSSRRLRGGGREGLVVRRARTGRPCSATARSGDVVLLGVGVLDIADRVGDLLDGRGDALVALAALADRPVDRGADAERSPSTRARHSDR